MSESSPRSSNERSYDNNPHTSAGDIDSPLTTHAQLIAKSLAVTMAHLDSALGPSIAKEIIAVLRDEPFDLEIFCTCICSTEVCREIMKQIVENCRHEACLAPKK